MKKRKYRGGEDVEVEGGGCVEERCGKISEGQEVGRCDDRRGREEEVQMKKNSG